MRKERVARGWTLRDFAAHSGVNIGQASRIENGRRPPTERVAIACDAVYPERNGWFQEYYAELQTWSEVPAAFKDWGELEDKAAVLRNWSPSVVAGLLQTEPYAEALLRTYPAVSDETVKSRLLTRVERQRRLFGRDVLAWFILDELSLYREVGSAEVMTAQLRHLVEVATLPNVTMQVFPAVANPGVTGGFVIADEALYTEHMAGGLVYPNGESVSALLRIFDSLRSESYRVSETVTLLGRLESQWATGRSPLTPGPTAGTA